MDHRPRIGVSVSSRTGWRVFPAFWWALRRAGAEAVRINVGRRRDCLRGLDGLVIGGGDDISVALYGGTPMPTASFDKARDDLEMALIEEAERRRLPILGICRGSQLLNVARGGTLFEDMYARFPTAVPLHTPLPRKTIHIREGSRLASIVGPEPSRVNALHHQSVDRLGEGMAAVAWDDAGIVEAVELEDSERLVLGVQWHPELLVFSRRDWRLFRALVENACHPAVEAKTETGADPIGAGA